MIGVTGTVAKLGHHGIVGDAHVGIGEACARTPFPEYSRVAKLCHDLGPNGLDIGMNDTVTLGHVVVGGEDPSFSMWDLLKKAKDAEAALDVLMTRNRQQTERKLFIDYGWCSSNIDFVAGLSGDSSNYCDPSQECDSSVGCDSALSECCIVHDRCLQDPASGSTDRCPAVNCKGTTCDANLSVCAWGVRCCTFGQAGLQCDWTCVTASSAIAGGFALGDNSPQSDHNTGGDDADAVCSD